jgi:hypothetical protein
MPPYGLEYAPAARIAGFLLPPLIVEALPSRQWEVCSQTTSAKRADAARRTGVRHGISLLPAAFQAPISSESDFPLASGR